MSSNVTEERRKSSPLAGIPEPLWAPLTAGLLVALPGVIGWLTGYPLLFPSLGPTAYLQAHHPNQSSAKLYNTIVGHFLGIAVAMLAVWLIGAGSEPSVLSSNRLGPLRLAASLIAIVLTLLFQIALKASHPPAAATTLLIALGGFSIKSKDAAILVIGILIVATAGELFRQLRQSNR